MSVFSSFPQPSIGRTPQKQPSSDIGNNNLNVGELNITVQKTSSELLTQIYKIIETKSLGRNPSIAKKNSIDETNEGLNWKCKCKKTKCLKLYCECFALGQYCRNCNCLDCHNLSQFDNLRAQAIDQALIRDPCAFDVKSKQRKGGCICKKTGCVKKYCECYNSGEPCTSECKCVNCENIISNPRNQSQNNQKIIMSND